MPFQPFGPGKTGGPLLIGKPGPAGPEGPQGRQGPPGPGTGAGAWQPTTAYTAAQVVQAPDGSMIRRTADGTSRSTFDATEQAAWTAVLASAGTVENTALTATFVARWAPNTDYSAGDKTVSPNGDIVTAIADFTSGATYDATKWDLTLTFASNRDALAASPIRKPRPPRTVLTNFPSGHGWTAGGAWASSNLNDTSDYVWGDRCLSGTTDGSGTGTYFSRVGGSWAPFDPTTEVLLIAAKFDNPTNLNDLQVFLSSSSGFTNYNTVVVSGPGATSVVCDPDDWTILSVDANATGSITGTGAGAAVNTLRLWLRDTGTPVTVKFGGIRRYTRVQPAFPTGVICMSFDDSYVAQRDYVVPYLAKYAFTATFYPIIGNLGLSWCYDLPDLVDFQNLHGHEIAGHASDAAHHIDLRTLSATDLEIELQTVKRWLVNNSFRSESYAWPNGLSNAAVRAATAQYFRQARTVGGPDEQLPPVDPARLRSRSLISTFTLATAKSLVDEAYREGRIVHFLAHNIVTTTPAPAPALEWAKSDFEALVDYIAGKGMPIMSLGDIMQLVE